MKEILIEAKDKEINESKEFFKYNNSILNNFFFFRFLNLLKLAKKRKINFEDIKKFNIDTNANEIIKDN